MSDAIKSIVASYIRLGDVKALNQMKALRTKLLMNLKISGNGAVDCYSLTRDLESELAIVDEALAALDPKPAEYDTEG
jgi:hypothetical protein